MRIGLGQINCSVGNAAVNCKKIASFAVRAKQAGCDVVIFPEMSDTGYVIAEISETASSWTDEPFQILAASAEENSIYLICGLSERVKDRIYNSIAVFNSDGKLVSKYRKTHLFSPSPVCEDKCFCPGSELALVEIGGIKWGLSICYDLRFPELYRSLALQGAQVLVNCTAWPNFRPAHWDYLTRARAIENQAYFIGADRVGTDGRMTFNGRSRIIDPLGEIVVEGSTAEEEVVVGSIDLSKVDQFRNVIPALRSRRKDIYGDLNGSDEQHVVVNTENGY
jgi:omega-amidase